MVFLTGLYLNDSDANDVNEVIEHFLQELIPANAEDFVKITRDFFFEPVSLPYMDGEITKSLMVFIQVKGNLIPVFNLEQQEIDKLNTTIKFLK